MEAGLNSVIAVYARDPVRSVGGANLHKLPLAG
jgi:hypothetical protein